MEQPSEFTQEELPFPADMLDGTHLQGEHLEIELLYVMQTTPAQIHTSLQVVLCLQLPIVNRADELHV